MARKVELTVVNINRNKISLCGAGIVGMLEMSLPADVVADLGVVDQNRLDQQIAEFMKTKGVPAGELVMVLGADVCFEKEIKREPETKIELETQKFLDSVPVLGTGSKVYEVDGTYKIVVISRGFYEGLRQAFGKAGFAVKVVVPGFVLGAVGAGEVFDEQACKLLLGHLDQVAGYGFELEEKKEETFVVQKDKFLNAHKILIAVLCAASVVMLVLTWLLTRV